MEKSQADLLSSENELNHLLTNYNNPYLEQIEQLNYEIGQITQMKIEAKQGLKYLEEVDRQDRIFVKKATALSSLKETIRQLQKDITDKEQLIRQLSSVFKDILFAFEFPKLTSAFIDERNYLPYVRNVKYNDIGSLASITLITMAYYIAILLMGIKDEFCHLGLLMIDSPRKNLGAQAKENEDVVFRDERIYEAIINYLLKLEELHEEIQIIVISNGYPAFLPSEYIIADFDRTGEDGTVIGLIDDAVE